MTDTTPNPHVPPVPPPDLNIQTMIAEAAKRHNILLKSDDPALVLLTLFEQVTAHNVKIILHDLTMAQNAITATMVQQTNASKEIAERIVNEGSAYVAKRVEEAGANMAPNITKAVIEGMRPSFDAFAKASAEQSRNNRVAVWCATVSVAASVVSLMVLVAALLR